MAKKKKRHLDFKIDKLTNSIENTVTGESFATQILPVSKDLLRNITKKNGWLFNWKTEVTDASRIYKLVTLENLNIVQGLVSLSIERDYVVINLIESAPFNRGKQKQYSGVLGNLVAFACKTSFATNGSGYVSFYAKTKLIRHYIEILGASHEGGQLMVLYPEQSMSLVKKYFNTI